MQTSAEPMATLTGEFAFPSFTSAVKQVSHRPYSSLLVGIMFNRWPTNNFSFVYCAWGRVKNTGMIFIEAKRYWLLMFDIKRGGIGARCEYCFSCANGVSVRVDTALTHYRPIRMTAPAQTCTRWHVQIVEYVSQNSKYIEPLQSCLKECSATFQTSTPSYRLPILRELSRLFQIYESYVSKLDPYLLKRYTAYFGGILKKRKCLVFVSVFDVAQVYFTKHLWLVCRRKVICPYALQVCRQKIPSLSSAFNPYALPLASLAPTSLQGWMAVSYSSFVAAFLSHLLVNMFLFCCRSGAEVRCRIDGKKFISEIRWNLQWASSTV